MSDDARTATELAAAQQAIDEAARLRSLADALARKDDALHDALAQIERVREVIAHPEGILGSAATKHGEIAEQVEVAVRNARSLLAEELPTATFDGVGRTAPVDYLIDGVAVQSKFVNGVNKNLDHVLEHLSKYTGFTNDGAYYHVPKDHYAVLEKAVRGEPVDGLSERTVQKIIEKIARVREATGQELGDVIRPGVSDYAEVQQGRITQTLGKHDDSLREEVRDMRREIRAEHEPGWADAAAAVGKGAAVGAAVRFGATLWAKRKERGSLRALTEEDWKQLGLEAGRGGLQGGVAAGALFALTRATDLTAPFAGSVVSAAIGLKALWERRRRGEIDDVELVELAEVVGAEAAIVALATFAGQALIPVPALGAVIGAVSGRVITGLAKRGLERSDGALVRELEERFGARIAAAEAEHQALLKDMLARFDEVGELTALAFDLDRNVALRLRASVELAERHGVPDGLILRTTDDLDAFMKGI